jgi:hypothetical protein
VFQRAWDDIINRDAKSGEAELEARDAYLWFMSNDTDGLFSFVTICEFLDKDVDAVRKRVKLNYGEDDAR